MFGKHTSDTAHRAPRNTTAEVYDNPAMMLLDAMNEKSPGDAIRNQEATGQQSFVNSDTLPTEMGQDDRKVLQKAGVKFGKPVPGDGLFTYVTLPQGWHKDGSSHDMWSYLVDDKGRKRASIFYKAAFYDRRAFLRTDRRYGISTDYAYEDSNNAVRYNVTDGDQVVFTTDAVPFTEKYSDEYDEADKTARTEALAWLKVKFPKWEDNGAYWD
jgi:hypothetical protein